MSGFSNYTALLAVQPRTEIVTYYYTHISAYVQPQIKEHQLRCANFIIDVWQPHNTDISLGLCNQLPFPVKPNYEVS